ncbi:sodium:calcium antiporter [Nitrosomonas sp. Is37]|uniref:sodium:calcium antiporter n=1 Tax=Nitrosomonas sp. Is37 TaxID=3080535 RepID=UPI00294B210D|nr:sodium:calcium antiporter [Nitrosomonas sp. Is37]MDV6343200.1 sodium:calcium antiporter [Nitrosomonas sp. Is37]
MISPYALPWLEFLLCLSVIGYAGVKLSVFGDVIADKTGLGGSWVGVIMLATVTSLPELVTGVISVTVAELPDIAVGNALGACVINLFILVLLDFLHRGESVFQESSQGHILSASFGVLMIGFVGFSILLSHNGYQLSFGHMGFYTFILVIMYGVAVRSVFQYEKNHVAAFADHAPDRRPDLSLFQSVARYAAAAVLVVIAAIALPFVGEHIAQDMGWQRSFVGTVFIALATSIPEMVVSIAAMRIGALNMAVASLLGSNLFTMFILAIDDVLYTRGPLLAHVSPVHGVSAFSAVMMTSLAIIGLFYRPNGRVLHTVGWTSLFMFVVYLLNTYILYLYEH